MWGKRPTEMGKWLIYTVLCLLADALDTILCAITPARRPGADFLTSDIELLPDEEIIKLTEKSSLLRPEYLVYLLTPNTVAKVSEEFEEYAPDSPEANALNLVFAKTTIPVPRVRRVIKVEWYYLIVMDYVEGPTLAEVWSSFSALQKIGVAFTLRRYIRQLRRLKASPTTPVGPVSPYGARTCESPIFGPIQPNRGPFASYAELSDFFKKRLLMSLKYHKVPQEHPSRKERFDDSEPLVLTHQDLNPRNIIVGKDGRLWIVDWAWAGYYPPWFEFVAMVRQEENERSIGSHHDFWDTIIPFVCGPYFKQKKWLGLVGWGLYCK